MESLYWYLTVSVGLCLFALADLVSHRTWHIAVMVVAVLAFAVCVGFSVSALPAP